MFDIELIEDGKFLPKQQTFKPRETFQFIKVMFEAQMKIQKLDFIFITDVDKIDKNLDDQRLIQSGRNHKRNAKNELPETLIGD